MVRASYPIADKIKAAVDNQPEGALKMNAESLVKQQMEGIAIGMKAFRSALASSLKQMQTLVR